MWDGTGSNTKISCSENTSLGVVCLHYITDLLVNKKRRSRLNKNSFCNGFFFFHFLRLCSLGRNHAWGERLVTDT